MVALLSASTEEAVLLSGTTGEGSVLDNLPSTPTGAAVLPLKLCWASPATVVLLCGVTPKVPGDGSLPFETSAVTQFLKIRGWGAALMISELPLGSFFLFLAG